MRHGLRTTALAVGACALLAACFGSGSPTPTAARTHSNRSHGSTPSTDPTSQGTPPTSAPTTEPTTSPTTGPTSSSLPLAFSPKSDGRHSHTCYTITGSDPVDFVYYPVMVKAPTPLRLTTAAVTYADGVQVAGAWVAPSAPTHGTGTVEGWPAPAILTRSTSVQWSKRVPAAGATLTPGTWYNVFLHLRVYPDALPLATDGVDLRFTAGGSDNSVVWVDHLAFQTTC
jgi:hypothetical protein